jgi:hypothetical protein
MSWNCPKLQTSYSHVSSKLGAEKPTKLSTTQSGFPCLLCSCRTCLLLLVTHQSTMSGPYTLWHMLHRLRTAAPQLEVHLFRAAADKLLCSSDSSSRGPYDPNKGRHATMHADSVAHISAYVSEVSLKGRQGRC